jgi:deazaflavin-dependent oxidoreductase (nitroreductase family)
LSQQPPPAAQREQFLYLTTRGWRTGRQHEIEIWFVEHGGKYYIVSERGDRAHWVKNILHDRSVAFKVGNSRALRGIARPVSQEETALAAQVSKLMDAKYGWSQGLIVEMEPQVQPM